MRLESFSIRGLGHLSTLVADEDAGVAAIVDPRRDVDIYLDAAAERGLRITHILETHLHNDYVSGGRDLAALTGATHVIGAGAELRYEHAGLAGGAGFDVGRLRFEVLDTPGHTPEHVSYRVVDGSVSDDPGLLLSGGSILVGAVGRTDLLGQGARGRVRPRHVPLDPRHAAAARRRRARPPDPRRRVVVLDGDRRCVVDDDRPRAVVRPAAGPDGDRRVRAGAARRAAGDPPLLRADAAAEPGRAAAAARFVADPAAAGPGRGRGGGRRRRDARGRATGGGARRRPHPGVGLDPARGLVRDVAWLGGRPRPAGRVDPRPAGRPRPPHAPGDPDRARRHRRLSRWRGRGVGRLRAPGRIRAGGCRSTSWPRRWRARAPPRRRW